MDEVAATSGGAHAQTRTLLGVFGMCANTHQNSRQSISMCVSAEGTLTHALGLTTALFACMRACVRACVRAARRVLSALVGSLAVEHVRLLLVSWPEAAAVGLPPLRLTALHLACLLPAWGADADAVSRRLGWIDGVGLR